MTGLLRAARFRAAIGLIAAYAVALQAVFSVLAPMEVRADGTVAVYCSSSESAALPDGDTGTPVPATGKMNCVFCGACAGGFAVLPVVSGVADLLVARPLLLEREPRRIRLAAIHVRDGAARAPPLSM
jgi:hypothetical protein